MPRVWSVHSYGRLVDVLHGVNTSLISRASEVKLFTSIHSDSPWRLLRLIRLLFVVPLHAHLKPTRRSSRTLNKLLLSSRMLRTTRRLSTPNIGRLSLGRWRC